MKSRQWPRYLLRAIVEPGRGEGDEVGPLANPIRALARKNGTFLQPLQMNIQKWEPALRHHEPMALTDRRTRAASINFEPFKPVMATQASTVSVDPARPRQKRGVQADSEICLCASTLAPRSWLNPICRRTSKKTDAQHYARNRAAETAAYPEVPDRMEPEVLWVPTSRNAPFGSGKSLFDAIRGAAGSIERCLCERTHRSRRPEELLQPPLLTCSPRSAVCVDSAMMSDVPGFSWGTVI